MKTSAHAAFRAVMRVTGGRAGSGRSLQSGALHAGLEHSAP